MGRGGEMGSGEADGVLMTSAPPSAAKGLLGTDGMGGEVPGSSRTSFEGERRDSTLPMPKLASRRSIAGEGELRQAEVPNLVYGWGSNLSKLVADEEDRVFRHPRLADMVEFERSELTKVSGGFKHAAALTADGYCYTWGLNSFGQLGRESDAELCTAEDRLRKMDPVPMPLWLGDDVYAVDVACGARHTLLVTQTGKVYGFGDNSRGAVGATQLEILGFDSSDEPGIYGHVTKGREAALTACFRHLDADKSGDVSMLELMSLTPDEGAGIAQRYREARRDMHWFDDNSDKRIDLPEFQKVLGEMVADMDDEDFSELIADILSSAPVTVEAVDLSGMTRVQLFKFMFDMIDADGNGTIDHNELMQVAGDLAPRDAWEATKQLLHFIDKDGDNLVSWEEFLEAMELLMDSLAMEDIEEHVREVLRAKDQAALNKHNKEELNPLKKGEKPVDLKAVFDEPVMVLGGLSGKKVVGIAAGDGCSFAWTNDGGLFAWGQGLVGQLGLGAVTSAPQPTPVPAMSGKIVKKVCCGAEHTLVLTQAGDLYSFGNGTMGQLGHGRPRPEFFPKYVSAFFSFKHTIPEDGFDPTRTTKLRKRAEGIRTRLVDVAAGAHFSAALDDEGRVYTWGEGRSGQLGHGERSRELKPREVEFFSGTCITSVHSSFAGDHLLFLSEHNDLFCVGLNMQGELGFTHGVKSSLDTPQLVEILASRKVLTVGCSSRTVFAIVKAEGPYLAHQPYNASCIATRPFVLDFGTPFSTKDVDAPLWLSARMADGRPLPEWMSFDSEHCIFSSEGTARDVVGDLVFMIECEDVLGNRASCSFTLSVDPVPTIWTVKPQRGPMQGNFALQISGVNLGRDSDVFRAEVAGVEARIISQRAGFVTLACSPLPEVLNGEDMSGAVVLESTSCGIVTSDSQFTYCAAGTIEAAVVYVPPVPEEEEVPQDKKGKDAKGKGAIIIPEGPHSAIKGGGMVEITGTRLFTSEDPAADLKFVRFCGVLAKIESVSMSEENPDLCRILASAGTATPEIQARVIDGPPPPPEGVDPKSLPPIPPEDVHSHLGDIVIESWTYGKALLPESFRYIENGPEEPPL